MHTGLLLILLLLSFSNFLEADDAGSSDNRNFGGESSHRSIWVLLIAGSNDFVNYRHQSDVCHAYQLMIKHGIPENRIITMMYDDIAYNPMNPYPGQIFNRPNGPNVYEGVKIDYRGDDITPKAMLAVLSGNATEMAKIGTGRVIDSKETDNIFVYFSDHGGPNFLSIIDDQLFADDIQATLVEMHNNKRFKRLVFYTEACESGSIFLDMRTDINVYAVTAADATQSSYATYCGRGMPMLDACLGDEFSVSWLELAEQEDFQLTQLKLEYEVVKSEVKYSHVCRFGDIGVSSHVLAEFMGWKNAPNQPPMEPVKRVSWPSRDIQLMKARRNYENAKTEDEKKLRKEQLQQIEMRREYLRTFMVEFARTLTSNDNDAEVKLNKIIDNQPKSIKQMDCYKTAVRAFANKCFGFSQNPYALNYIYILANLCELHYQPAEILAQIDAQCAHIEMRDIE